MARESASDTPRVQLTGRAARFVQLLQDLGHLDQEAANRVLVGVGELASGPVADLPEVRRAVAMVLFPVGEGEGQGLLAEDWPVLFS